MSHLTSPASTEVVRVIGQSLCLVSEQTGKEFGELEASAWCKSFADCDPVELKQAFDSFALHSPFAPSPANIHQELQRLRFGGVSGAWTMVRQAAEQSLYGYCFVVFEHSAIHFAIDAIGGWFQLRRQIKNMDRVGLLRRDFVTAFEDYRPSLPHSAGMGSFNGHNAVLIGHKDRALQVYRTGVKYGQSGIVGVELLRTLANPDLQQNSAVWPEQLGDEHMEQPPEPSNLPLRYPWETDEMYEARVAANPTDNNL